MMGKRGKIAFVSLEDLSGQVEIMVGGQTLENCADCLKADQVLIIESKVSRDDYGGGDGLRILANQVMTLQTARERYARSLSLALAPHHDIGGLVQLLAAHQLPDTPRIPLQLSYANEKRRAGFKCRRNGRLHRAPHCSANWKHCSAAGRCASTGNQK